MSLDDYRRHSAYSDPRAHAALLEELPTGIAELTAIIRNLVVHYRADGLTFTGDRLEEVNHRWVDRMLDSDQRRFPVPLRQERPKQERIVGCCRDFTLLTVAALRQHGIAARSRVGFASYFSPGFNHDHVIAEYFNGERWVWVDAELDPQAGWDFDTQDIPPGGGDFVTAAKVWTAFRQGEIDARLYGVGPGVPIGGDWFIYNYVFMELAHLMRDELLLWDGWGAMTGDMADADVALADEIAAMVLDGREEELAKRYAGDSRLRPGDTVLSHSPTGETVKAQLARASGS